MDQFLPEKLAIKYCEQYMIERGTKKYEMAINAFCVGFSLGKTQNKVNRPDVCDGCEHNLGKKVICGLPSLTPCDK